MKRLLDWVQGLALAMGGPGLFLIAFLDDQPQTNKKPNRVVKPNREVKMESPKPRTAPCIPAYDSSGAQTRPCG